MKIIEPIVFRNYDFTRASVATYYGADGLLNEALVNELRLGYNPSTLEFIGPVIEDEATNEFLNSNDFAADSWTATSVSINILNPQITPDGTLTAQYLSSGSGFGFIDTPAPLSGVCSVSIYAKWKYGNTVLFINGVGTTAAFNTLTGVVVSQVDCACSVQALPNGWFRLIAVSSVSGSTIGFQIGGMPGGSQCFIWGAQIEIGTTATSYIETSDEPATRAADIAADDPPRVVSSNVPEDDAPVWDDGDSYVAGNQVMVLGQYHRVYESIGANINKFPPDHPEEWIDQGATNRWRMFDMAVGADKQTFSEGSDNTVQVLLDLNQPVNSVVLLNLEGSNVRVIMRDSLGNEVYNFYQELTGSIYESSWWSFFFGTRHVTKSIVLTDLPPYQPATIEMILDGGAGVAKIGKMIVGNAIDIGCTRYGVGVGILDFSRKERDPFGNNFILQRRYVDRADFDIQILTSRVDEVQQLLASLRATPVIYVGDEGFTSTVIYGFYRDFSIVISGPKRSDATLQIEGI